MYVLSLMCVSTAHIQLQLHSVAYNCILLNTYSCMCAQTVRNIYSVSQMCVCEGHGVVRVFHTQPNETHSYTLHRIHPDTLHRTHSDTLHCVQVTEPGGSLTQDSTYHILTLYIEYILTLYIEHILTLYTLQVTESGGFFTQHPTLYTTKTIKCWVLCSRDTFLQLSP